MNVCSFLFQQPVEDEQMDSCKGSTDATGK